MDEKVHCTNRHQLGMIRSNCHYDHSGIYKRNISQYFFININSFGKSNEGSLNNR